MIVVYFLLYLWIVTGYEVTDLKQERAMIKSFNPKYISVAQAFTFRRTRGGPYRTNITITTLHDWGNNVTVRILLRKKGDTDLFLDIKACQLIDFKWTADFIKEFSDIPLVCPCQQGVQKFFNIVFPPKSFPFPIPKKDFEIRISAHLTKTFEKIIEFGIIIRV